MGRFCTPNQHFWYFRYICLLNFSEIAPGERHWKVCKSDCFCILRKIYYAQNGGNVSFWTIALNAFEFSSKSVCWIFLMFYLNTGIKLGESEVKITLCSKWVNSSSFRTVSPLLLLACLFSNLSGYLKTKETTIYQFFFCQGSLKKQPDSVGWR